MAPGCEEEYDEEYSVIDDKEEIGFLDFEDDPSLRGFEPLEEGPVLISTPFAFIDGKPQSALVGEISADSIIITNTTEEPMTLWSVRIYCSNPEGSFTLSLMKPPTSDVNEHSFHAFVGMTEMEDRVLQPHHTLTIWLSCKPIDIGMHTSILHFDLDDEKIERVAFLLAEDKISRALLSKRPFSRASHRSRSVFAEQYVAGYRPPRKASQGFKRKLPQYKIPTDIRELVENKQIPDVVMEGLSRRSYAAYFSTLLVMEEIHLEAEMRAHDMECVNMRQRGSYLLSLEVPGLAERRPSLVYGDYIFAKLATEDPNYDQNTYQGYIHRVEADQIFLKFDLEFHCHHWDGHLYNIRFTYNRINMRRLYHATSSAQKLGREFLFPSNSSRMRVIQTSPLVPLNPCINTEQARSVELILGCKGGPPYLIHGPPGTGKTVTLVEAILQVYTTRKEAHILVCAASNSAADHVLEKILSNKSVEVQKNQIFRLNATSRPYDDVKPEVVQFCFFEDLVFKCPPLGALTSYKIILSTYMSASLLYAEGIKSGHFSHIFLDEAGQASEPETMIPISYLCVRETVVVLAGDPMQLGPVVYSKIAESYGLGKSYLQRLFECECYANRNENYVTKLIRNYRSHRAILELPSNLFYNGELIACKEGTESPIYDWPELPNKDFPVLFVGIQGCDEREGNNPSWFNRTEASKVVDIIRKLKRNADLDAADFGVITPYRQQVLKLKAVLELLDMQDVKVGSVEQFQGQENEIIIISTVRSTVKHNEFDRTFNLGFLSNHRRFNVAITRARSLLIIVGNPFILSKDPYWDKLLWYCVDNGSYQGCPLPPQEKHHIIGHKASTSEEDEWGEGASTPYLSKSRIPKL